MLRIIRGYRLQASALSYAVFIMIVVLILLTSVIVLAQLNSRIISNSTIGSDLQSSVNSGINLLLANEGTCEIGEKKHIVLFDNVQDSISLSRERWGVFDLCKVNVEKKHQELSKTFLSGGYQSDQDNIALSLVDKKRPLSVCGNTHIEGDCYVPKAGVKRTIIDGRSFSGTKMIYGKVLYSEAEIPTLNGHLSGISVGYFISRFILESNCTIIEWENLNNGQLEHTFNEDPIVIYSPTRISLSQIDFQSNIIIISEKGITVNHECNLEDVILCAPCIYLDSDLDATIQCIASDSLVLDENSQLNYPSALIVANDSEGSAGFMKISQGSKINGIVISNTIHDPRSKGPVLVIEDAAIIEGQLWCNSFLDISGSVYGPAYVQSFYLKTPSSIYENHLLDAEFNRNRLPEYYTGLELFFDDKTQKVIKWLN